MKQQYIFPFPARSRKFYSGKGIRKRGQTLHLLDFGTFTGRDKGGVIGQNDGIQTDKSFRGLHAECNLSFRKFNGIRKPHPMP